MEPLTTDLSAESPALRNLSDEQKERLTSLLDRYMDALESGVPPSVDQLVDGNPDLADSLRRYIGGLEGLHKISAGFASPSTNPSQDNSDESESPIQRGQLGDFELLNEIGRGGMGVVYRAKQISLGRFVALKLLPFAAVLDGRQISRFKNEAQSAAQAHHPNIVPVYAIGAERGVHYYAMQLIDGQSLDQVIESQFNASEPLDIQRCLTSAIEIADGLHAAHEYGVVHRDVKPSNILLDRDGKSWVTDFGLARCQTDASLTKSGDLVGTMKYMSPEQARGEAALVDGRTDVYSLGATLYEMLALRPIFDGENAPTILRRVTDETPVPLRKLRPEIPLDLETVVAKAIAKSRDDRYQTARLFADDLRRVVAGEPTIARPPTTLDRLTRWTHRHRRIAVGVVGLLLASLIGVSVMNARIAAERNWRQESEQLARGAVDRLGAQMAELLSDIPSADSVRRQLLADTIDYYEEFAQRASGDPRLEHDLAVTYGKIGSLQRELGAKQESVAALTKSEQMFAAMFSADSSNQNLRQEHAAVQNNLALSLQQAGDSATARKFYEAAISQQESLAETRDDALLKSELALSLNNIGLLLSAQGEPQQAGESYRRSIEILEGIAGDDEEIAKQLSATRNNLSGLLTKSDPSEAARLARSALQSQVAAMRSSKGDPKLATRVALSLNNLGTALVELGQFDQAVESYQQAVEIQSQLLARWPDQLAYHRDAAVSWNNLGLGLSNQKNYQEASEAFLKSLEHHELVSQAFVDDAGLQSTLGGIHNNLAFVYQRLGEDDQSLAAYQDAIRHQSQAYDASDSQDAGYREYLSKHYFNYARLLRSRGDFAPAMGATLSRRELWQGNGQRLANVAEELIQTHREMQQAGVDPSECAAEVKATVNMAVQAGNPEARSLHQE